MLCPRVFMEDIISQKIQEVLSSTAEKMEKLKKIIEIA